MHKVTYLDGQLSGGTHDDSLNLAQSELTILSEPFRQWQGESQCLARASQISCDDVFPIVDWVETVHLHGEEFFVPFGDKSL